jgi:hypothetical protein
VVVTIDRVTRETLKNGDEQKVKPVIYFRGAKKALVCNVTNWTEIADLTGKDDDADWKGVVIELYPHTTEVKGKPTPCVRVRAPRQAELSLKTSSAAAQELPPAMVDTTLDDVIPF